MPDQRQTSIDGRIKDAVIKLLDLQEEIATTPASHSGPGGFSAQYVATVKERFEALCSVLDDDVYSLSGVDRDTREAVSLPEALEQVKQTLDIFRSEKEHMHFVAIMGKEGQMKVVRHLNEMKEIVDSL